MTAGEPPREYITRAKGLAAAVKFHGRDITDEQLDNRILTGLPPHMHFVREGFTIRMNFSITELEYAIIKAEELQKPGA